jgi:type I restriction enzyme, R subunit
MTHNVLSESVIEEAALAWFASAGWWIQSGVDLAPGVSNPERNDYSQSILALRLRDSLARLNPDLPPEALDDAFRKLTRLEGADLVTRNRAMHRFLVDGVTVEYRTAAGEIRGAQVRVIDFDNPSNNEWLAANQFIIVENKHTRRPDIVLFVNGLPLAVVELKNAADEDATIWTAYEQLQTYQAEAPSLFLPNELLVISDGIEARLGTLGAGREWFKRWRTITGERLADSYTPELQVLIDGVFAPRRFLDLVRDFVVFEDDGTQITKKMAGYHQFHAVQVAVRETLRAAELQQVGDHLPDRQRRDERKSGDRRIGVVWHTQGSGKSLTMAFYAGRIIREPAMKNPTVVVLTDRNDLDDQLFGTFSRCKDLLRQPPVQADSRPHLRQLLSVEAGGVVFTTIQKFLPEEKGDRHPVLSERRNVVVIADEAHRSQYELSEAGEGLRQDVEAGGLIGSDVQLTARCLIQLGDRLQRLLVELDDSLRITLQNLSRRRQQHLLSASVEKLFSTLLLQ